MTSPLVKVRIAISVSVCLSACLSTRISHAPGNNAICSVYFRFVDDVTFTNNGANGSESEPTRVFRAVRQVAAPGAKSAVSDFIFFSLD